MAHNEAIINNKLQYNSSKSREQLLHMVEDKTNFTYILLRFKYIDSHQHTHIRTDPGFNKLTTTTCKILTNTFKYLLRT